jgi:hypothetical protein
MMEVGHREIEYLRMARFWRDGIPPQSGGYLDQAAWAVSICDFINIERERAHG